VPQKICPQCQREFGFDQLTCPDDGVVLVHGVVSERQPWPLGETIAKRYVITQLLGEGSISRVYRARDAETDKAVAVKLLSEKQLKNPEFRTRFMLEGQAAMKIAHPNVIHAYECGEFDGGPYMIMELVTGESLGDFLRRERLMSSDLAMIMFRQVAAGLEASHDAQVVHRDVKPDNLFLVGEPGDPYGVKIIDYGLARVEHYQVTTVGVAVGTAEYMAPEQVLAEGADVRTDIYALGMVMFRTLTAEWPFSGTSLEAILAHHLFSATPPPSWLVDDLGESIDTLVQSATRKHPDNRYQCMAAMRQDMEKVIGLESGSATGATSSIEPDLYLPTSPLGRQVERGLAEKCGHELPRRVPEKPTHHQPWSPE